MRKISFFCLIYLCAIATYGQTNFIPGYIVGKSGDTLKGQIDFRSWDLNPLSISFKQDNNIRVYFPKDILGFSVDQDVYKSAVVSYQLGEIDPLKASESYTDAVLTDTVFLRQLVRGKYNLYSLITKKRPYFFSQVMAAGEMTELISRVKINEHNQVTEDKQYKDLLLAYAQRENMRDKLLTRVTNMSYTTENMVQVVKALNQNNGVDLTEGEKKKKVNHLEIGLGGMANLYSTKSEPITNTTAPPLLNSATFTNTYAPLFSLGIVFGTKRAFNKIQAGIYLEFTQAKIEGVAERSTGFARKEEYSANLNLLKSSMSLTYIFNPLSNTKFYIVPRLGITNVLGNRTGTTIQTNMTGGQNERAEYPTFLGYHAFFGLGTGMLIGKNKIELKLDNTGSIMADDFSKTSLSALQVSLSYSFRVLDF